MFLTGQFNVLIVPLQKFLDKVTPRLSPSEPVYGNKDTVERLIDSHKVSIMSSDINSRIFCEELYFHKYKNTIISATYTVSFFYNTSPETSLNCKYSYNNSASDN